MPDSRIMSIDIVFDDGKSNTTGRIQWHRETFQWTVEGPLFPRYIQLMNLISEALVKENR